MFPRRGEDDVLGVCAKITSWKVAQIPTSIFLQDYFAILFSIFHLEMKVIVSSLIVDTDSRVSSRYRSKQKRKTRLPIPGLPVMRIEVKQSCFLLVLMFLRLNRSWSQRYPWLQGSTSVSKDGFHQTPWFLSANEQSFDLALILPEQETFHSPIRNSSSSSLAAQNNSPHKTK